VLAFKLFLWNRLEKFSLILLILVFLMDGWFLCFGSMFGWKVVWLVSC